MNALNAFAGKKADKKQQDVHEYNAFIQEAIEETFAAVKHSTVIDRRMFGQVNFGWYTSPVTLEPNFVHSLTSSGGGHKAEGTHSFRRVAVPECALSRATRGLRHPVVLDAAHTEIFMSDYTAI